MVSRQYTLLLFLLVVSRRIVLITGITGSKCDPTRSRCYRWNLSSTWTQGGYRASCKRDSSAITYVMKVYVVRKIYSCADKNSRQNLTKITNDYFDEDGKLCHLSKGDDQCPGLSNLTKPYEKTLKLQLFCGDFKCTMEYHRCDFCPMAPWYTRVPKRLMRKYHRKMDCKMQLRISNMTRKRGRRVCLNCDGKVVNETFCAKPSGLSYYVDVASSIPSWSEWIQLSECRADENQFLSCDNATAKGTISFVKHCRYPKSRVKLDPKYCGSIRNKITVHCRLKLPPCSAEDLHHFSGSWKEVHTWLVILIILLVVVIVISLWIYMEYRDLRWRTDSSYKLCPMGFCKCCEPEASPHYSPRRIITEPEYALIGDWRQNVGVYPQGRVKYNVADDSLYATVEECRFSDESCDEDSDDSDTTGHSRLLDSAQTDSFSDLDASEKRALYAQVRKCKSET